MEQDEAVYSSDYGRATPTTGASGPEGGGTTYGTDAGANKRDPISSSPTIGHTIAGRNLDGESTETTDLIGGGTHEDRLHRDD